MVLIFGGAYQGKLEFAQDNFDIKDSDIFRCSENADLDYTKKVFANFHQFVLGCVKDGVEAKEVLADNRELLNDKIFIVDDISQGVVPMDKELRAWREMVGRTMLYLSKESDSVYRVFCGIGQQIK